MSDPIEAFAVIGSRGYYWAHVALSLERHVAIKTDKVAAHVICDVLESPERIGSKHTLMSESSLPLCGECLSILNDLDAKGARDLLKGLERGAEAP